MFEGWYPPPSPAAPCRPHQSRDATGQSGEFTPGKGPAAIQHHRPGRWTHACFLARLLNELVGVEQDRLREAQTERLGPFLRLITSSKVIGFRPTALYAAGWVFIGLAKVVGRSMS